MELREENITNSVILKTIFKLTRIKIIRHIHFEILMERNELETNSENDIPKWIEIIRNRLQQNQNRNYGNF